MTASIRIAARAWGATAVVTRNGESQTHEIGAHGNHDIHISPGESVTVEVSEPAEAPVDRAAELMDEEVPGRAQNDALLGQDPATPPTGNESGADETAMTTETEEAAEPPLGDNRSSPRGRRNG